MKNLLVLLMLFCASTAFAAAEPGNYKGTLSVIVDSDPQQDYLNQVVVVTDDGTNVQLKISNFTFPGFALPLTIRVNATKDSQGNLELVSITVVGITIDSTEFEATLVDGHLSLAMAINALGHDVIVFFEGDK